MSSNCDSDGVPMDHDGQRMEDYLPHTAPFAIRTDVFQELFTGSGKDRDVGHLETEPARGAQFDVQRSSSGGIPLVDDFTVEDYVSSDEELPSSPVARVQPNVTSATVQAVLRSSKHERDALVNARNKLNSVLKFLKSKGYSEEQIYEEMSLDGFGPRMPVRDGFGLPRVSKADGNPFVDKMKSKLDEQEVFVELPKPVSAHLSEKKSEVPKVFGNLSQKNPTGDKPSPEVKSSESVQEKGSGIASWANVVKNDIPSKVNFKFFPVAKGTNEVNPPDEVLMKGNDKFKNCVVGTFSKGSHSYKVVSEFAFQVWKSKGLLTVCQKDVSTYVFRFANDSGVNEVLSRGTWYISRRPMIVTAWGLKPGSSTITSMPLWIKLANVPDCYWTDEGLARLASVVGEPIGADSMTAKLDLLPFAKLQVRYNIGDPLPSDIQATVLDPVTLERSTVKVLITYPVKPLFCSGCNSLGHSTSACPKVIRIWKPKEKLPVENIAGSSSASDAKKDTDTVEASHEDPVINVKANSESDWTEVKRKKSMSDCEASPSPPVTFKNLKALDEIAAKRGATGKSNANVSPKRLTKSQKKRQKASGGIDPSSLS